MYKEVLLLAFGFELALLISIIQFFLYKLNRFELQGDYGGRRRFKHYMIRFIVFLYGSCILLLLLYILP